MRSNLPFLSAASNALLKTSGRLKRKRRLVKDVRHSLQLTEVMKIVTLTSPLPDVHRLSSPRPMLRHGRRLALLSRPNLCILFFVLSLALLPPLLTSPTVSLPGYRLWSSPITCDLTFLSPSQRPCVAEPETTFPSSAEPRALKSHSSFCYPFSPAEFLAAASNLFSSTATGPDEVAHPMLKHLPRSGMDFLVHIFNLSWSLHSFPTIWKTSSIIPSHIMGKPLNSPAFFRPTSISKLFKRITLSHLLFFLESNPILSPYQTGFHPRRSTLDQIPSLSQSISDGFNKPRPGSLTILATIDFSKAFDSVWHYALFNKLISAGLPLCFARWTQAFLSGRHACVVYQNHKSRSFRVRRGVPQGSVLGPILFSLFINDLPASLLASVSCCFYANVLAVWSSCPSVPTAVEATKGALIQLERWSEYWCLPLNPSKCEASFFLVDPQLANLLPNLLLFNSGLCFNPFQLFLGSPSTALFSLLNMFLRGKPSFSLVSRPYAVSLLPHGAPLKSLSIFPIELFFGPFSHMLHPYRFLS